MAGRVGHPYTTAYTQLFTALACVAHREAPEVLRLAEQIIELARTRGFVWWREWATMLRGWALAELGRPREGLEIMLRPIEYSRRAGLRVAMPLHMSLLAMVHLKLGQVRDALVAIRWGLTLSAETGDRNSDSGLHRLRGECLRRLGRDGEAMRCYLRAIVIAREQGAVLYELRAKVDLGRLLRDTGRPGAAERVLSRILARFDGEDGVDLQEARALQKELEIALAAPPPSGAGRA
jgi:tetratricopeptide (TPR) repeat protein